MIAWLFFTKSRPKFQTILWIRIIILSMCVNFMFSSDWIEIYKEFCQLKLLSCLTFHSLFIFPQLSSHQKRSLNFLHRRIKCVHFHTIFKCYAKIIYNMFFNDTMEQKPKLLSKNYFFLSQLILTHHRIHRNPFLFFFYSLGLVRS